MAEPLPPLPDAVARFRAEYRTEVIPRRYRGGLHALATFGGGTLALVACLAQLQEVRPLEWLAVPVTFVYGTSPNTSGIAGRCTGRGPA